jgi:hypothetical protein
MNTRMACWIQVLPHPRVIVFGHAPPSMLYFIQNMGTYMTLCPQLITFIYISTPIFPMVSYLPTKTFPLAILVGKLSRLTMEKLTLGSTSMSLAIL